MPDMTYKPSERNVIQRRIKSNSINCKEICKPQVLMDEFPKRQHAFQRSEVVPSKQSHNKTVNPLICNSNDTVVFRDRIMNLRSNFNKPLKVVISGVTSNDLLCYITAILDEGQFDIAIHNEMNDVMANTMGTESKIS